LISINAAPNGPTIHCFKEASMRAFDAARAVIARLAALITGRGRDFVCGECERRQQCALPPTKRCVVMAAQIERNGGRAIKRAILPQF
jgi:hypothetical protein